MYQRILTPVADGAASDQGVDEAVRLAQLSGAVLCFTHVAEDYGRLSGFDGTVAEYLERLATQDSACRDAMARASRKARQAGVACDIRMRHAAEGSTSSLIAREARLWQADVIVMGEDADESTRFSSRIASESPVPVLAVLGPWRALRGANRHQACASSPLKT